jgi:hypothetical protein
MSSYIPRLARIIAGVRTARFKSGESETDAGTAPNAERLARLMPKIRHQLAVSPSLSDEALLASLVAIARHPSDEERWHAAEASTLGQHLAVTSHDMRRALVTLLSLLPRPTA